MELAIVLMIIGLLIGGILRGQELMENARVTSTIQQTKAYDGATTTFRDAYGVLPGDMANPQNRLANCIGDCALSDANSGNNRLGTNFITAFAGTSYDAQPASENRRFWLQLAVARLISGVDASGAQTNAWGVMYPAAKIGGGFNAAFVNIAAAAPVPGVSGHFLVLRNGAVNTAAASANEATGTAALSPLRAAQIDRKLDDGLPQTGDVVGIGTANCTTAAGYVETTEVRDCNLLIRVQN